MRVTQHFNELSEAESERLDVLVEECAEVVQAAMKIKRHGYGSRNNREELEMELGHVLNAIDMLEEGRDVDERAVDFHKAEKSASIVPWLHHQ